MVYIYTEHINESAKYHISYAVLRGTASQRNCDEQDKSLAVILSPFLRLSFYISVTEKKPTKIACGPKSAMFLLSRTTFKNDLLQTRYELTVFTARE